MWAQKLLQLSRLTAKQVADFLKAQPEVMDLISKGMIELEKQEQAVIANKEVYEAAKKLNEKTYKFHWEKIQKIQRRVLDVGSTEWTDTLKLYEVQKDKNITEEARISIEEGIKRFETAILKDSDKKYQNALIKRIKSAKEELELINNRPIQQTAIKEMEHLKDNFQNIDKNIHSDIKQKRREYLTQVLSGPFDLNNMEQYTVKASENFVKQKKIIEKALANQSDPVHAQFYDRLIQAGDFEPIFDRQIERMAKLSYEKYKQYEDHPQIDDPHFQKSVTKNDLSQQQQHEELNHEVEVSSDDNNQSANINSNDTMINRMQAPKAKQQQQSSILKKMSNFTAVESDIEIFTGAPALAQRMHVHMNVATTAVKIESKQTSANESLNLIKTVETKSEKTPELQAQHELEEAQLKQRVKQKNDLKLEQQQKQFEEMLNYNNKYNDNNQLEYTNLQQESLIINNEKFVEETENMMKGMDLRNDINNIGNDNQDYTNTNYNYTEEELKQKTQREKEEFLRCLKEEKLNAEIDMSLLNEEERKLQRQEEIEDRTKDYVQSQKEGEEQIDEEEAKRREYEGFRLYAYKNARSKIFENLDDFHDDLMETLYKQEQEAKETVKDPDWEKFYDPHAEAYYENGEMFTNDDIENFDFEKNTQMLKEKYKDVVGNDPQFEDLLKDYDPYKQKMEERRQRKQNNQQSSSSEERSSGWTSEDDVLKKDPFVRTSPGLRQNEFNKIDDQAEMLIKNRHQNSFLYQEDRLHLNQFNQSHKSHDGNSIYVDQNIENKLQQNDNQQEYQTNIIINDDEYVKDQQSKQTSNSNNQTQSQILQSENVSNQTDSALTATAAQAQKQNVHSQIKNDIKQQNQNGDFNLFNSIDNSQIGRQKHIVSKRLQPEDNNQNEDLIKIKKFAEDTSFIQDSKCFNYFNIDNAKNIQDQKHIIYQTLDPSKDIDNDANYVNNQQQITQSNNNQTQGKQQNDQKDGIDLKVTKVKEQAQQLKQKQSLGSQSWFYRLAELKKLPARQLLKEINTNTETAILNGIERLELACLTEKNKQEQERMLFKARIASHQFQKLINDRDHFKEHGLEMWQEKLNELLSKKPKSVLQGYRSQIKAGLKKYMDLGKKDQHYFNEFNQYNQKWEEILKNIEDSKNKNSSKAKAK